MGCSAFGGVGSAARLLPGWGSTLRLCACRRRLTVVAVSCIGIVGRTARKTLEVRTERLRIIRG